MSKLKEEGLVSVSITAGELIATGNKNDDSHQFRMGHINHIHFTPEAARQWVEVLTPIAKESSK